jgi:hypothetical protein
MVFGKQVCQRMSIEQNFSIRFIASPALREKQIQQNYRPRFQSRSERHAAPAAGNPQESVYAEDDVPVDRPDAYSGVPFQLRRAIGAPIATLGARVVVTI